jgi:hypothetical protein
MGNSGTKRIQHQYNSLVRTEIQHGTGRTHIRIEFVAKGFEQIPIALYSSHGSKRERQSRAALITFLRDQGIERMHQKDW